MKSAVWFVLILMITLYGCSSNGKTEDKVQDKNKSATEYNNTSEEVNKKDIPDDKNEGIIINDKDDPLYYAKNIIEDIRREGYHSWRNRKDRYSGSVDSISKEYLCSTNWFESNGEYGGGYCLVFYLDDEFRIGTYEGGMELKGKYSITGNKVKLYDCVSMTNDGESPDNMKRFTAALFSDNQWVLNYEISHDDFWYTDHLYGINKNYFFGAYGSNPAPGKEYVINGVKAIKDEWEAVSNERVMFRVKPDKDAKTQKVGLAGEYDLSGAKYDKFPLLDFMLKGARFTVLGRTKEKAIVDGKENYWYYIKYRAYKWDMGWVFGEYIEPYKKDRAKEYKDIYLKEIDSVV